MLTAREALKVFGQRIGLPDLEFNDEGFCAFDVNDTLEIYLSGDAGGPNVQLTAAIAALHDTGPDGAKKLLKLNFRGTQTGGAAFAIDPTTDEVLLTKQIRTSLMNDDDVVPEIEEFVRVAVAWHEGLPQMAQSSSQQNIPEGDDATVFMRL